LAGADKVRPVGDTRCEGLGFVPSFEGDLEAFLLQGELGEVVFADQSDELLDVFKFQCLASVRKRV
jgi:hypothetical protein